MSRPVIFLDIDGVMNSENTIRRFQDTARFGAESVFALNMILYLSNAAIVISSTWRKVHDISFINRVLLANGCLAGAIDRTPDMEDYKQCIGIYLAVSRAEEIQGWLVRNPDCKNYVILDDESDMGDLAEHHVHVDPRLGLTKVNAEEAIRILRKDGVDG